MKLKVQHPDGRIETLTLLGDWTATDSALKNAQGFEHFFNADGTYDGWGCAVPEGTTMETAQQLSDDMEAKRELRATGLSLHADAVDRVLAENTRLRAALASGAAAADDLLEDLQLEGFHRKPWYPAAVALVRNLDAALAHQTSGEQR